MCAHLLLVRQLQIHRQNVAAEQQRTTKRRAPQAPSSPSLSSSSSSSSRPAAEPGIETSMDLLLCSLYI